MWSGKWQSFCLGLNVLTVGRLSSVYRTNNFRKSFLVSISHETWWRHQMETFSALLALCVGNPPVPVNSPHKGQWRGALMFSLICARINDWVNNHEAGDLRRHRGHYDVSVMYFRGFCSACCCNYIVSFSMIHVSTCIHVMLRGVVLQFVRSDENKDGQSINRPINQSINQSIKFYRAASLTPGKLVCSEVLLNRLSPGSIFLYLGPLLLSWINFNPNMDK